MTSSDLLLESIPHRYTGMSLNLVPFGLTRISHTLFRCDLLRPILPAFRSILLWTVCTHTARQQNQRAPWQNGARGVSRRKVHEKCGLERVSRLVQVKFEERGLARMARV